MDGVLEALAAEYGSLQEVLAAYFLLLNPGQMLLNVRELGERFHASLGSISSAINSLESQGAVRISRSGRLGSTLEQKDSGILWKLLGKGPMVIALTLPSFPKAEGLATAISTLLSQAGVQAYMTFIRGSYNRLDTLRKKHCHAAVISEFAADELCSDQEEIILRLPPQSFVTDHRVFFRSPPPQAPLRVATDADSFDIARLTELEFAGQEVVFVPLSFVQADLYLTQSPVDAAISNYDHLSRLRDGEFQSRPLSGRVLDVVGTRATSAAVVIDAGDLVVKKILTELLDPQAIIEIQQKVCDGKLVPRY